MTEQDLLTFPCEFPIKLIARGEVDLETIARTIVQQEAIHPNDARSSLTRSRHGRYQSVTVTIQAEERAELDRLYGAFTREKAILIVL